MQEYCGDVINFKTYFKSFKLKKRIKNDTENMAVFRDVHEPVIDRVDFEKIQQKRGTTRKRKTYDGERNMFSGLLVCADCGGNLNFHFNQGNHAIRYFNCANNNSGRKTCPTTHYIRVDFLEEVLLKEIRRLTKFASQYEDEFAWLVMGHSQKTADSERQGKQRKLSKLLARDRELDGLFNRMYEDNVSGKIDDDRFARMSRSYAEEQSAIAAKLKLRAKHATNRTINWNSYYIRVEIHGESLLFLFGMMGVIGRRNLELGRHARRQTCRPARIIIHSIQQVGT